MGAATTMLEYNLDPKSIGSYGSSVKIAGILSLDNSISQRLVDVPLASLRIKKFREVRYHIQEHLAGILTIGKNSNGYPVTSTAGSCSRRSR